MDVGNRVTQEQLPKVLTTQVTRSLGFARDDSKKKTVILFLTNDLFQIRSQMPLNRLK